MSTLDILLSMEIPQPQRKQIKIKRLSKEAGNDVVLTIQQLSFSRVAEIRGATDVDTSMDAQIVLAGVVDPDLKNPELQKKFSVVTPLELVKKLFLPGEITDIAREIEKLTGYRTQTLEAVKKN